QQEVPEEDVLEEEPEPAAESESIVRAQAFNETNMLTGSIAITVPPTVAQRYGSGIGATVLAPEDLALPEDGEVLGGLYALYPAGITFEEPLSLELSVANIPASYNAADIYPAYLRGVAWEEFADYQAGLSGYTFMLEKVPSGPIAVIWNPAEEEQSAEDLLFTSVIPTIDTDGDGLTDAEEALFGTSAADPDTDGDTHLDLAEIQNGYSPLEAGALLDGSGLFSTYTNTTYGYRVSYPSSWLASGLDQSNKQVLFVSDTDEFFEILIEENPLNTPIADWFRGQSPSLANVALDVAAVGGKPGVWSPDGLTLYVSSDGLIYIITYNNGTRDDVSWPNAFEYFYKSFSFGSTNSPANEAGEEEEAAEEEA
ncbi:MAG: hypothetical protein U1C18_01440, partial [Patescibacteria group bacterium]|nr:hypothetical protein [Patescibacteria group bacterium]